MDSIFRHNDPSKGPMKTVEVENWKIPEIAIDMFLQGRSFQQQIDGIKDLALRDDDIIVCAYAKCGKYLLSLHH